MRLLDFIQSSNVPKNYVRESMIWSKPCNTIKEALTNVTKRADAQDSHDLFIGTHIIAITVNNIPKFIVYGTKCLPNAFKK